MYGKLFSLIERGMVETSPGEDQTFPDGFVSLFRPGVFPFFSWASSAFPVSMKNVAPRRDATRALSRERDVTGLWSPASSRFFFLLSTSAL